jgi:tetratricopeptide (TPR) repeat protein
VRFPADEEETREDLYAEVWRRLELDPERLSDFERRQKEAGRLFEELTRADPEEQGSRLGEARFQSSDLLDLLMEECHAGQLANPGRAESLAHLAARLAASLSTDEPEAPAALARACCLGANARRLGGDPSGADGLLARAVLFLECDSERAFYSRTAALVRWEQGRLDEADALLHRAQRLYLREGLDHERATCQALLGLLWFEDPSLGSPGPPLIEGWRGMVRDFHPLVAVRAGLALAAWQAERGEPEKARRLLREVWPLFSRVREERELTTLYWYEGLVLGRLGERDEAVQMLESVRRRLAEEMRWAEAALVSIDLARLLAESERAGETPAVAAVVEGLLPEDPVFRMAANHIADLGAIAVEQPSSLAEAALAAAGALRTAFRGYRMSLRPLPFA